jgi:hypothetical protein
MGDIICRPTQTHPSACWSKPPYVHCCRLKNSQAVTSDWTANCILVHTARREAARAQWVISCHPTPTIPTVCRSKPPILHCCRLPNLLPGLQINGKALLQRRLSMYVQTKPHQDINALHSHTSKQPGSTAKPKDTICKSPVKKTQTT